MTAPSKGEPTWGYRAKTDTTPESEVVTTDAGPIWGRIFADGALPDGWHASPVTIPAADDKPKKGQIVGGMTTALDIVTRALRRINVIAPDETPEGSEAQAALDSLNDMIGSWPSMGLSIAETSFPLDQRFNGALVALLAVRVAEDYGKSPGPMLLGDARSGWHALQAAFAPNPDITLDLGVTLTTGRGVYQWTYLVDQFTVITAPVPLPASGIIDGGQA